MTFRPMAHLTFITHLYKALFRSYHHEMLGALSILIPEDAVVFDVGAHAGQYSKIFSRLAPKGQVYAFEPATYTFRILSVVCKFKGFKNVILIKKGLGSTDSTVMLRMPIKKSGSFGYGLSHTGRIDRNKTYFSEEITITTCDNVLTERNTQKLDFVKMDIEGGEMEMLRGATHALSVLKPVLFIEMNDHALKRNGSSSLELWDFLHAKNYKPFLFVREAFEPVPTLSEDNDLFWIPSTSTLPGF